jgi:hypothetical protein
MAALWQTLWRLIMLFHNAKLPASRTLPMRTALYQLDAYPECSAYYVRNQPLGFGLIT